MDRPTSIHAHNRNTHRISTQHPRRARDSRRSPRRTLRRRDARIRLARAATIRAGGAPPAPHGRVRQPDARFEWRLARLVSQFEPRDKRGPVRPLLAVRCVAAPRIWLCGRGDDGAEVEDSLCQAAVVGDGLCPPEARDDGHAGAEFGARRRHGEWFFFFGARRLNIFLIQLSSGFRRRSETFYRGVRSSEGCTDRTSP